MEYCMLSNGVKIPRLGYRLSAEDDSLCRCSVLEALKAGYRWLDFGRDTGRVQAAGAAIVRSGVRREDLFLSADVHLLKSDGTKARQIVEALMNSVQSEYLDLVILEKPGNSPAWQALEELYEEGRIRALGVSGLGTEELTDFCRKVNIRPMLCVSEALPTADQEEMSICLKRLKLVPAFLWSLKPWQQDILQEPGLLEVAARSRHSPEQVLLRWYIQQGQLVCAQPRVYRCMMEIMRVFDFELKEQDMDQIDRLGSL